MATVLRKGRLHVIPATQLVPGDIVEVAGQHCPAATTLCSAVKLLLQMCMQPWHQQEIAAHACITDCQNVFGTHQGSQQTITGKTVYTKHQLFKAFDNRAPKKLLV